MGRWFLLRSSSLTSDRLTRVLGGTKVSSFPDTSSVLRPGSCSPGSCVRFALARDRCLRVGLTPARVSGSIRCRGFPDRERCSRLGTQQKASWSMVPI